jgi:2',3'-cyclic-nucleotide 2'-phosphodiesterase (5'-nucleotidase family)
MMKRSIRHGALAGLLALAAALPAQALTLLVTADMHGWLEPAKDGDAYVGGAAEMLAAWRQQEHLQEGDALILSCGDDYTGPAISTYFKGDSVTDAMNGMGYDASALGNHEFDFGVPKLMELALASRFPFLACNLTRTAATAPALPVQTFKLFKVQGVKVAVIGLTLRQLAGLADAEGWDGTDYAVALRQWVPLARAQGAQAVVVIGHVPYRDLMAAAESVKDLGVPVFFGGHSHETSLGRAPGGAWVVNPGCWWRSYARVDLDVDGDKARVLSARLVDLRGPQADAKTRAQLNLPHWQKRLAGVAGPVLGYSAAGLPRRWALSNMITDAWLAADPGADVAVCNFHGIRQDLPAGPVNNLQLLSVLPFEDKLVAFTLTGRDLLSFLGPADRPFEQRSGESLVTGGLKAQGADWVLAKTGRKLDPAATYRMVSTDYLGDHDPALQGRPQLALRPSWRDPIVDYLRAHPSSEARPLEGQVDAAARAAE